MSMTVQVRLTDDEAEVVRQRTQQGQSQSQVVHEAFACLMNTEIDALMAEGYEEMAAANAAFAESVLPAQREVVPDE